MWTHKGCEALKKMYETLLCFGTPEDMIMGWERNVKFLFQVANEQMINV